MAEKNPNDVSGVSRSQAARQFVFFNLMGSAAITRYIKVIIDAPEDARPGLDIPPGGMLLCRYMKKGACHCEKLPALRRIEGQVCGVQKMIEDGRYCIDILNATRAIQGALRKVETDILRDHLNACVKTTFEKSSERAKDTKIEEICDLLGGLRR